MINRLPIVLMFAAEAPSFCSLITELARDDVRETKMEIKRKRRREREIEG